jgi:hypothetical protein
MVGLFADPDMIEDTELQALHPAPWVAADDELSRSKIDSPPPSSLLPPPSSLKLNSLTAVDDGLVCQHDGLSPPSIVAFCEGCDERVADQVHCEK